MSRDHLRPLAVLGRRALRTSASSISRTVLNESPQRRILLADRFILDPGASQRTANPTRSSARCPTNGGAPRRERAPQVTHSVSRIKRGLFSWRPLVEMLPLDPLMVVQRSREKPMTDPRVAHELLGLVRVRSGRIAA